jgi:hypothetical protein
MARMSIDDAVLRDPRITELAALAGWSRREALGCLLEIWAICYDRVDTSLGPKVINLIAGREDFADLMLEVELASPSPSGKLRIAGAKERIGYLAKLKQYGREGGLKSSEQKRNNVKGTDKPAVKPTVKPTVKPAHNPIATVPDTVPDPDTATPPDPVAEIIPPRGGNTRRLPDSWEPARTEANQAAEAAATGRGVDLRLELTKLRDWAKSSNAKKADWDATWRNWTRNARPSKATNQTGFDAVMAIARGETP